MDKDLVRFYSFILDFADENACWEWTGSTHDGYGKFHFRNRAVIAHRWLYQYYVGIIPMGYVIDHKCNNRKCVNLTHLQAITRAENSRKSAVGRSKLAFCLRGHERKPENLYPDGYCKLCAALRKSYVR